MTLILPDDFSAAKQPHVSNSMVHISGVSEDLVTSHARDVFHSATSCAPSIHAPNKNPQFCGKFAMPFADSLLEHGIVDSHNLSFSLVVLSKMKPTFVVCTDGKSYRCRLTHDSCRIMMEHHPESVGIVGPTSKGQSYSFKSTQIAGEETASSITVHKSGTLQYQGI